MPNFFLKGAANEDVMPLHVIHFNNTRNNIKSELHVAVECKSVGGRSREAMLFDRATST